MEILRSTCPPSVQARALAPGPAIAQSIPFYKIKIIKTYPHDPEAFTQGLVYRDGFFYESTGLTGKSGIRKVEPETGRVIKKYDLPARHFGEGLTDWEGSLIQLTWQSGRGFVYNRESFAVEREFSYSGEGWGITHDEKSLIMSNGSNRLTFLNPRTFALERTLEVFADGKPVRNLNELEYIKGEILANVWLTDVLARISPKTGEVTGWIDLSELRGKIPAGTRAEALNGIAYDPKSDRILVTGKYWPKVFEIEIVGLD